MCLTQCESLELLYLCAYWFAIDARLSAAKRLFLSRAMRSFRFSRLKIWHPLPARKFLPSYWIPSSSTQPIRALYSFALVILTISFHTAPLSSAFCSFTFFTFSFAILISGSRGLERPLFVVWTIVVGDACFWVPGSCIVA